MRRCPFCYPTPSATLRAGSALPCEGRGHGDHRRRGVRSRFVVGFIFRHEEVEGAVLGGDIQSHIAKIAVHLRVD
jgi:hypothetical protein